MTTTTPEKHAHAQAVRASVPEMAKALQALLGQKVTAVIADVRDPKAVGAWARGERVPHTTTQRRLFEAYQILMLLRTKESDEAIRLWFMGTNPQLEDRAPAVVIGNEPDLVKRAAREFLVHG